MRDDRTHLAEAAAYRVVILTLDAHAAGPAARVDAAPCKRLPRHLRSRSTPPPNGPKTPPPWPRAKAAVREADIVVANLLFLEEHVDRRSCPT